MKFRIIYIIFMLGLTAFLFFGNAGGRAASQNQGNTGAPGDELQLNGMPQTCQTCHNAGSFQTQPVLSITDMNGDPVTTDYIGGETYNVKLTINATPMPTGNGGFGFQIVALNAAQGVNGSSINSWTENAANVQVATAGANGRQYAEHMGISGPNVFDMQWTAPAAGAGPVTFYYCGNTVNGDNNSSTGDNAICGNLELSEAPVATNDLEKNVALNVFPNPVQDMMLVKTNSQTASTYELMLFDQSGKTALSQLLEVTSGEKTDFIDVSALPTGFYNLVLTDGPNKISQKIIKQ